MEEFKIIKLPENKNEETDQKESKGSKESVEPNKVEIPVDDNYTPLKKRYIFLLGILLIAIVSLMVIRTI